MSDGIKTAVSIVVPAMSSPDHFRECTDSILSQTLQNTEILCIDEGGEGSEEFPYAGYGNGNRVRVIRTDARNAGARMNCAMSQARGEYIAFMDENAFYSQPSALAELYRAAREYDAPIICGRTQDPEDGTAGDGTDPRRQGPVKDTDGPAWISLTDFQGYDHLPCCLVRLDFIRENGISFPDYPQWHQPLFLMRAMLRAGKILTDSVPVCVCRGSGEMTDWNPETIGTLICSMSELLRVSAEHSLWAYHTSLGIRVQEDYLSYMTGRFRAEDPRLAVQSLILTEHICHGQVSQKQPGLYTDGEPVALRKIYEAIALLWDAELRDDGSVSEKEECLDGLVARFAGAWESETLPHKGKPEEHTGRILEQMIRLADTDTYRALETRWQNPRYQDEKKTVFELLSWTPVETAVRDAVEETDRWLQAKKIRALFQYTDTDELIPCLAYACRLQEDTVASVLKNIPSLCYRQRPSGKICTIGVYCGTIGGGGIGRVMTELSSMWLRRTDDGNNPMFRVVFVTEDDDKKDESFTADPEIRKVKVPPARTCEQYAARYAAWQDILTEYSIDIVVYTNFYRHEEFLDLLSVKSHPSAPAVIGHWQSNCARTFDSRQYMGVGFYGFFRLCDGAVALSECDALWLSSFCPNARAIANPMTYRPEETRISKGHNHQILWIGHLYPAIKQPQDAVMMMTEVVRKVPDAVLTILGDGEEKTKKMLLDTINKAGLADHVRMPGFSAHPEEYYRNASLLICTSKHEGFSLTICEALTHAVPVLTYDLSWITPIRDGHGVVTVARNDWHMMAEKAVEMLLSPDQSEEIGLDGYRHMMEVARKPIAEEWWDLFDSLDRADRTEKDGIPAGDRGNAIILNRSIADTVNNSIRDLNAKAGVYRQEAVRWKQKATESSEKSASWKEKATKWQKAAEEWKGKAAEYESKANSLQHEIEEIKGSGLFKIIGRVHSFRKRRS